MELTLRDLPAKIGGRSEIKLHYSHQWRVRLTRPANPARYDAALYVGRIMDAHNDYTIQRQPNKENTEGQPRREQDDLPKRGI